MEKHDIYLGLGTNLGQRERNIRQAIDGLKKGMDIIAVSPIYETAAWGVEEQPDFLNLCLHGQTDLAPRDLLRFVKDLEVALGREETFRWGPRLIDIDILLMEGVVMNVPGLTIPHEGLPNRAFVLVPLADIAPHVVHPLNGKTVQEMLQAVDAGSVRPFRVAASTQRPNK